MLRIRHSFTSFNLSDCVYGVGGGAAYQYTLLRLSLILEETINHLVQFVQELALARLHVPIHYCASEASRVILAILGRSKSKVLLRS